MVRKSLLALSALLLCFGAFSALGTNADAQSGTNCQTYNDCVASYPQNGFGALRPTATPTATPQPTSSAVVSADTVAATTGSGSGAGAASIAFTGSESRVLGYIGASMIGVGALALAGARRQRQDG